MPIQPIPTNTTEHDVVIQLLLFILDFLKLGTPQSLITVIGVLSYAGRRLGVLKKAVEIMTAWEARRREVAANKPAPPAMNGNGEMTKMLFMAAENTLEQLSKRIDTEKEQRAENIAHLRRALQDAEWNAQNQVNNLQLQVNRLIDANGRKHDEIDRRLEALEKQEKAA